ncbi:hypothetical protein LV779_19690 [Streptomyces thinghirensis]|nr:hypothetical protein [Streptomyces thinghirensis]
MAALAATLVQPLAARADAPPAPPVGRQAREGRRPARPHPRAVLLRPAGPLRQRRHPQRPGRPDRHPARHRLRPHRQGLLPGWRPQGPDREARLHQGPGHHLHLDGAHLQEPARAGDRGERLRRLPRLLDHRLHPGRPAFRHQPGPQEPHLQGARQGHEGLLRRHHQPHRRRRRLRGEVLRLPLQGRLPVPDQGRRALRRRRLREGRPPVPRVDAGSFPRTPVVPAAKKDLKVPRWLNDPAMYHNRGDSTWAGESATYGDFSGLDDPVDRTARGRRRHGEDLPAVGQGLRHRRLPHRHGQARRHGVLDPVGDRPGRLRGEEGPGRLLHVRRGLLRRHGRHLPVRHPGPPGLHAGLPFQDAARGYASQGGSARKLAAVFGDDWKYTTDKANAYEQVTFLGNHDMGRFGTAFLKQDNPKATDAELLKKDKLANELMFLSRGNPVIYYGDEQGFTGAGGDKDARQPMFASRTADYLDDDQLGTDRTHADAAYDTRAPLYQQISALAKAPQGTPRPSPTASRPSATRPTAPASTPSPAPTPNAAPSTSSPSTTPTRRRPRPSPPARPTMTFRGLYGTDATVRSGADKKVTVAVPRRVRGRPQGRRPARRSPPPSRPSPSPPPNPAPPAPSS